MDDMAEEQHERSGRPEADQVDGARVLDDPAERVAQASARAGVLAGARSGRPVGGGGLRGRDWPAAPRAPGVARAGGGSGTGAAQVR